MRPLSSFNKPLTAQNVARLMDCNVEQVRLMGAFLDDEPKSSLAAYYIYLEKHPSKTTMQYVAGTGTMKTERLEPVDLTCMTLETPTDKHLIEMKLVVQPPPIITTCARDPKEHVINRFTSDGSWPSFTWKHKNWQRSRQVQRLSSVDKTNSNEFDSVSSGFGSERISGPSFSEDDNESQSVEKWINKSEFGLLPPYEVPQWEPQMPCNPSQVPCNPLPVPCNPPQMPCNPPPMPCNPPPMPCNPPPGSYFNGSVAYPPSDYPPNSSNFLPYYIVRAPDNFIFIPFNYPPHPFFYQGSESLGINRDVPPVPYNYLQSDAHNASLCYSG